MSRRSQSIKAHFTTSEDNLLTDIINKNPKKNWSKITEIFNDKIMSKCNSYLQMRTERQIKERWVNYLSPDINRDPWTDEEDELLIAKHSELGPKWVAISNFFKGRTDIALKNRFRTITAKGNKPKTLPKEERVEKETTIIPSNQLFDIPPQISEIQDVLLESTKAFLEFNDSVFDSLFYYNSHSF